MALRMFAKSTTITEATRPIAREELQSARIEQPADTWPAEWYPQSGVMLTWPHAHTDWAPMLRQVEACYLQMAYHIASQEQLLVVTPEPGRIETLLRQHLPERLMANVSLVCCESDDTWARDHGPLCVLEGGLWTVKDFGFNAWGGKFPFEKDNAITARVFQNGTWHANYQDCTDFILEGGSVESDGRGTILTTAQCLLNPNRNPRLSAADIEERLLRELHARRVLWLHHGHMDGDDTDAHIDTLARLCPADTIAYVQCTDPDDGHYDDLQHMEAELRNLRTLEDRPYRLLPLPLPAPVYDEDDGTRLPATYANFLVLNGSVLVPTYAQPELDRTACETIQKAFPTHQVVGIDCRPLIRQHGSLHCCTMQLPRGVMGQSSE